MIGTAAMMNVVAAHVCWKNPSDSRNVMRSPFPRDPPCTGRSVHYDAASRLPSPTAIFQEPCMNLKLIVAICALAATPAFAQGQPKPPTAPKPTKAEVQKVVQSIGGDKAKLQAYCDMGKLNQQMAAADEKNDTKTLQTLGPQADALLAKLGPDYGKLMEGLDQVDENSAEGKDFAAAFDGLDKQCK
jgi:hypothetical protein